MKEQPTPETDAFFRSFADGEATPSHAEYYDRMTRLERERDQWRDAHDMQLRLLGDAIKQRNEAREQASDLHNKWLSTGTAAEHLGKELHETREQRDRLAEALREACCAYPITWYRQAQDAMAAVEGDANDGMTSHYHNQK